MLPDKYKNLIKKDRRGMTLIEMLIACVVMVLLMGILTVLVVQTFFVNRYVLEQGMNTNELQKLIRDFSANLREARQSDAGGYLVSQADDHELVFFANIDEDSKTERVRYYLQGTEVRLGIAESAGFPPQYPDEDQEVKIVGRGIINGVSRPLFYYFNDDYPEDTANNPLETPVDPKNISLIKIDIFANIDPNHVPDSMRMETYVKPRNIE